MTGQQRELLGAAIEASEDELYLLLGEELLSEQLGIAPKDRESLKTKAKGFADQIFSQAREKLCSEQFMKHLNELESQDEKKAVYLVLDVLVGLVAGVPAIYLSILFLKIGLKRLCPINYNDLP